MPPPGLDQIKAIFVQAVDKSGSEREAFLHEACGNDAELLAEVKAFLAAAENAGGFLSSSSAVLSSAVFGTSGSPFEGPGSIIGPYKLLELIGEGGFGSVFMAEQEKPIRRKVALKIIKLGMDTKQVIARFEAERQALAMMDHPNIAKVFEAGATQTGRPYFVMELVRGIPITEYCDRQELTTAQRVELFSQICHAIQHAHQKGIIHRDIKPSNVLVTMHDDRSVPKVIDFGIAKATSQRLTEKTLFTEFRQFIGTPAYMSPEQAQPNELDVDTRSDIYSLGVLLYELLTGTTPFDSKALRAAAYDEIRRVIREVDPPKPSTRISGLGEMLASVAQHRRIEPAKLVRSVIGELDWMVMKCLEKDRTRRYETASDLSRDIQRYLKDEPVEASPPSATYKVRKWAQRHRAGLRFAVAMAVVLIAATVIGTTEAIRANRARAAALVEKQRADDQAAVALAQEERANDQAAVAEQTTESLHQSLDWANDAAWKLIWAANPGDRNPVRTVKLAERAVVLNPQNGGYWNTLGKARYLAGDFQGAIPDLEESARLYNGGTSWDFYFLAMSHWKLGNAQTARQYFQQAVVWMVQYGADDSRLISFCDEATDMMGADLEIAAYRQGLEICRLAKDKNPRPLFIALTSFGMQLYKQQRYGDAEAAYREALQLRPSVSDGSGDPEWVLENQLGVLLSLQRKFPQAEQMLQRAIQSEKVDTQVNDFDRANTMSWIGGAIAGQGRCGEAEPILLDAYARLKDAPDNEWGIQKIRALNQVVNLYDAAGEPRKAKEWRAKLPAAPANQAASPAQNQATIHPLELIFRTALSSFHIVGHAQGTGWAATPRDRSNFCLNYGPYTHAVPPGLCVAIYRLMIDDVTADNANVVSLDINDHAAGKILGNFSITRHQFKQANVYQDFEIYFDAPAHGELEFRTWYCGGCTVNQESVTVRWEE